METSLLVTCLTGARTVYHFAEQRNSGSLWLDGYYMDPTLSEVPLGDSIIVHLESGAGVAFDPVNAVVAAPRNASLQYTDNAATGFGLICANPLKTYVPLTRPILLASKLPEHGFSSLKISLSNGRTNAPLTVSATGSTVALLALHMNLVRAPANGAHTAALAAYAVRNERLNALARFNEY